jgi:pSer/pThr/pTyr-binding forkhead associated (FHA) protein
METLIGLIAVTFAALFVGLLIRSAIRAESRRRVGPKSLPAQRTRPPARPKAPSDSPPAAVPPGPVSAPARLTIGTSAGQQQVDVLVSPFTIGRRRENMLVLSDDHVSRSHARLQFEGGCWYVIDAGSSNGVFVNGRRVSVEQLQPGDEIDIGPYILRFDSAALARPDLRIEGPFELLETIGRGGMAVVYRARLTSSGQVVAAKIPTAEDDAMIRRFLREAEITQEMQHRNIVHVYGHGRLRNGRPYMLMEYLTGGSLRSRMAPGHTLSEPVVRSVGAQVAGALGYAHTHRVVHRDIKPENVLFDQQGSVRVADFGIAASEVGPRLTLSGMMIGTCHYMSPEQIDPERGPVMAASDLYSLGCMLYEMTTGSCPFEGAYQTVMFSHLNKDPAPVNQANSAVSPQLSETIHRLLRKAPADRPGSAEEVARALTAVS